MAKSKNPKINALRKLERYYLRVIARWRERRKNAKTPLAKARALRVIRRNRHKKNVILRKIRHERSAGHLLAYYDGRVIASWFVPYLNYARKHGWKGYVTSGYRTPEYSQSLCYAMCGKPSCPGKCAGLASHHSAKQKPYGAIDVSDAARFGQLMRDCPLKPAIFNALPVDIVHFSSTGN